jgi:hypothetical protein
MSTLKLSKELLEAMQAAERAVIENTRTDQIYGVRAGESPLATWPSDPCSIVFLDFDGVLNSDRSARELGTRYRFSRPSVEAFNLLLRETDVRIVISSSWREGWTLKENAQFLERDGVLPGRVIGKTPTLEGRKRGLEIDAWLASVPYPVKAFVILDDRDDMAMHLNRLVRVDPAVGITATQASHAIEILARPWTGHPRTKKNQ